MSYLGVNIFISKPADKSAKAMGNTLFTAYASTFFLTITNPVTILSFMAIFSGLGIATTGATTVHSFSLVLGVFLGSAFWWLLLSSLAGAVEHRMKKRSLHVIHRVSGLMLLGFGVWSLGNWLMGVKMDEGNSPRLLKYTRPCQKKDADDEKATE